MTERLKVLVWKTSDVLRASMGSNPILSVKELIMAEDKKEEIEIELDNETLMTLFMMAHEKDITLNQLVEQILREELDKADGK